MPLIVFDSLLTIHFCFTQQSTFQQSTCSIVTSAFSEISKTIHYNFQRSLEEDTTLIQHLQISLAKEILSS